MRVWVEGLGLRLGLGVWGRFRVWVRVRLVWG